MREMITMSSNFLSSQFHTSIFDYRRQMKAEKNTFIEVWHRLNYMNDVLDQIKDEMHHAVP